MLYLLSVYYSIPRTNIFVLLRLIDRIFRINHYLSQPITNCLYCIILKIHTTFQTTSIAVTHSMTNAVPAFAKTLEKVRIKLQEINAYQYNLDINKI